MIIPTKLQSNIIIGIVHLFKLTIATIVNINSCGF